MSTAAKLAPHQPVSSACAPRSEESLQPVQDMLCYLREFAQQKPEIAALTCLGIGFVLGWKLKPW